MAGADAERFFPQKAAVMCLLVPVETTAIRRRWSLQSVLREQDDNCTTSLLQIHIDKDPTEAKFDGGDTAILQTRFTIEDTKGKKCIQYMTTDKHDNNTRYYALKFIENTTVTFMNERCSLTTADAFLFDEERWQSPDGRRFRYYKHNNLYLGVSKHCTDDRLSLICSDIGDRRCAFRRRS